MSYSVETTNHFEKALKNRIKRGLDVEKFKLCVSILSEKEFYHLNTDLIN